MSSVVRSLGQTVSRTFSSGAAYYATYEVMQGVFSGELPTIGAYAGAPAVYNGNLILFANDTDLGTAVQILEKYCDATDDVNRGATTINTTLRDLGKKLHLGVQGGSSTLFTYNLVQITQGTPLTTDYVRKPVFVLTSTEILSEDLYTALTDTAPTPDDHYGLVYVSR
jgi:hypothetical protein